MTRRAWALLAALTLAAVMPPSPVTAAEAHPAHHDDASPARLALLAQAEQALDLGEVEKAASLLDSAALMAHAADTETLQIRTQMQAGQYRQALAFAAHTAGVHLDDPLAPALYAWLLDRGGQSAYARRMLDEAFARRERLAPDPQARAIAAMLADPRLPLPAALREPPHRFAPMATTLAVPPPPATAHVTGTGVIWADGRQALVPLGVLDGARAVWVRNGRGQTVFATRERSVPALDIAVLDLGGTLPPGPVRWAPRDPFAGSPGAVADYPPVNGGDAAWPRLHPGFLGATARTDRSRRLGIGLPAGSAGGPVFDSAGRLAGFALPRAHGTPVFQTVTALRAALGSSPNGVDAGTGAVPVMAFDEIYEHALCGALQVLVVP